MSQRSCLSIILAAGDGTRMKSTKPKVLHEIAHLPLVAHVANAALAAGGDRIALVVGNGADEVRGFVEKRIPGVESYVQEKRRGTAHAVLAAREAISRGYDDILVMFGDTPLIRPEALQAARAPLSDGASVVVMGFRTDKPAGYGRLIEDGSGRLVAIREDKDCTPEERRITFCNGGLMAISGRHALDLLQRVGSNNAKGEFYLTDIVEIARSLGLEAVASEADYENVLGINNRAELAEAELIWQQRRRREIMLSGVTMHAPDTVFLAHDTRIAPDVVIEPNVVFGPQVVVETGATIHAFSHLEGADVGPGASVGPFARLRPGTVMAEGSRVGNFCETKKADIGPGAKVNHLTYIGDATIGAKANIGAGTITCNYDGFNKHLTQIGAGAFIGSNSSLVAPVSVGDGAYVASGSVVTDNVPEDALAFGRARQTTKEGMAVRIREKNAAFSKK
jgi:bifunctional UDP-N-acetylglucosamine pyrophosphorylase/glucosamine-1-phosphate N-acetyltransferase